jgi:hypothetical protein
VTRPADDVPLTKGRLLWLLVAVGGWSLAFVGSWLLFGRRAPLLLLVSAAAAGLSVHATALWLHRSLGATVRTILSVPLLYLRELAPLLLPLVIVLLFMSRGLSVTVQLALGPLLLALAWLIVAADVVAAYFVVVRLPRIVRWAASSGEGRRVLRNAVVVVVFGLLVIVLFNRAIDRLHVYGVAGDLEGGTAQVIVFALGLWLVAFILCAFGAGTTKTRFLISSALVLVVLRFAAAAGLIPGWDGFWSRLGGDTLWLILGLLLPLAFGIAESVVARRDGRHVNAIVPPLLNEVAGYGGFVAALTSALLLAGATGWAIVETNAATVDQPANQAGTPIRPADSATPSSIFSGSHNRERLVALAARFGPILDLSRSENYGPESVADFLARNTLSLIATTSISKTGAAYEALTVPVWAERETKAGTGGQPDDPPKPEQQLVPRAGVDDLTAKTCRGRGGCTLACPDPTRFCVQRQTAPAEPPAAGTDFGVAYSHIIANGGRPLTGPSPWKDQPGEQPIAVVEYWLFYPYDYSETFTPLGILTQQHESDWEFVAVGLAPTHPLFVAYSAHCGGTWADWNDAYVDAPDQPTATSSTHPLVAVATGSHANYRDGKQARPPDWSSCKGNISGETTWALSYAASIRDRTEHGGSWIDTPAVDLVDGEPHSPVYFNGYWGRSDVTRLRNLRPDLPPIYRANHGPTSPPAHASWSHPLTTIFCSSHWTNKDGDSNWPGRSKACRNATVGG